MLFLIWAVLDRASRGWRGFTMTSEGTRALQDMRRAVLDAPTPLRPGRTATTDHDELTETVGAVTLHRHQCEPTSEDYTGSGTRPVHFLHPLCN